jgi:peroxiredoxin
VNRALWLIALVAVLAGAGGWFAAMKLAGGPEQAVNSAGGGPQTPAPEDLLGQRRPDFSHRDPAGQPVSAADFDGNALLVNFWATWCTPCVEEMPMLSELQHEFGPLGLQVVGIALDDAERAAAFAAELGLSYPVLVGGPDVVITGRRYGNRSGMLPFSVLTDRQGTVRWSHLGALDREDLTHQLESLLD